MEKLPIKIIAFDLGHVLILDESKLIEKRYHFNRLSKNQQQQYISAFHKAETGEIHTAELLKVIQKTLTPDLSIKELKNQMLTLPVIRSNWQLVQRLKKHYQIAILTNSQYNWPHVIAKRSGINLKQFPVINSAAIGLRKPSPAYFHYVFRKLKTKPGQMVFIDDRIVNIKTAKKLGIHAFHYQNDDKALTKFLRGLKIQGL